MYFALADARTLHLRGARKEADAHGDGKMLFASNNHLGVLGRTGLA